MPTCPKDGTPIDVDYGMATCPTCGVILFVDMDGEAQLGTQVPEQAPAPAAEAAEVMDEPTDPLPEVAPSFPSEDPDRVDPFAVLQPEHDPGPASSPEPETMSMDQFLGYEPNPIESQDVDPGVASPDPSTPDFGSPGDPLGIADYANSEFSQAKDGPFLFRVVISGIDSKEIRESLREAFTDNRFGWDVDAIMRDIAKGELMIQNVSPVKATIVINRIKRLPVRIRWEQYAVTQVDPN